jgi:colanic acid/amylovoran biosynthesis glycosyltransferase
LTKSSKTLYYFTLSYPFGFGEQWKKNELDVFSKYFHTIVVVPLSYSGNTKPKPLPPNTTLVGPIIDKPFHKIDYLVFFISLPFSNIFFKTVKEFISSGSWSNWQKFKTWFADSLLMLKLLKHSFFKDLVKKNNRDNVLYFFWGTGLSQALLFLNKNEFGKIVVRFHGIDLYEDRHRSQYIPYRTEQLKKLDLAALISKQGKDYITKRYSHIRFNAEVYRLGCLSKGLSIPSDDGVFRIVSCSAIIHVKRISLISQALRYIKKPVEWKHIGDGELRSEVEDLNKKLPDNILVNFVGKIESEKVLDEYVGKSIDLFLNVSESEGVPVAVMEAFSAGIPVLATDVGGTSEIVNNNLGKLLKPDVTPEELADEITNFAEKTTVSKNIIRRNCFEQYMNNCDAAVWATRMAEYLVKDK